MKGLFCIVAYNRKGNIVENITRLKQDLKVNGLLDFMDIVVSIDFSDKQEAISSYIHLNEPNIKVIKHNKNLGLKNHIILCGDMVLDKEYDFIVVLEDDIELSEFTVNYIYSALNVVEPRCAGISLYNYSIDESYLLDFNPKHDGSDNYYLQYPSSWGQVWTKAMWKNFKSWFIVNDCDDFHDYKVPAYVCAWPASSWKKHFLRYMVNEDLYFLYPRVSLTNNLGIDGENHNGIGAIFSVPILKGRKSWYLLPLSKSQSVYNSWFGVHETNDHKLSIKDVANIMHERKPLGIKYYLYLLLESITSKFKVLLK